MLTANASGALCQAPSTSLSTRPLQGVDHHCQVSWLVPACEASKPASDASKSASSHLWCQREDSWQKVCHPLWCKDEQGTARAACDPAWERGREGALWSHRRSDAQGRGHGSEGLAIRKLCWEQEPSPQPARNGKGFLPPAGKCFLQDLSMEGLPCWLSWERMHPPIPKAEPLTDCFLRGPKGPE